MDLKNKRILLSQHRLVDFTGSEIITLEMAEFFSSEGAEVIIVTDNLAYPIKTQFDKINNLKIYTDFFDKELDESIKNNPPDIAWIHHQIIIPSLFSKQALKKTKYLFNHMSSFYFQEFPLAHEIEQQLADVIFYNSIETKNAFDNDGLLRDVHDDKKIILNNPAPSSFHTKRIKPNNQLKRILIVSNHIPDDLLEAISILRSEKIYVEVVGISNKDAYRRITPSIIQDFDVTISIGKTVQYSLSGGVPVYCYDKFGGPGYITEKNFNKALEYNFSGRGFEKKTPQSIANELKSDFLFAQRSTFLLQKERTYIFDIKYVFNKVLDILNKPSPKYVNKKDEALYHHHLQLIDRLFKMEKMTNNQEQIINTLTSKNCELEVEKNRLTIEINNIVKSRVYAIVTRIKKIKSKIGRQ